MTNDTAELTTRRAYLERELAVWRGRKECALRSDNPGLHSLYLCDEFDSEIGKMIGELHRITHQLSCDTPSKPLGCGGKRRAKVVN